MSDIIQFNDQNNEGQNNGMRKTDQKELKSGAIQTRAVLGQINNHKIASNRAGDVRKDNVKKAEKETNKVSVQALKTFFCGAIKDAVSENQKLQKEFKKPEIPAVKPRLDTHWGKDTIQETAKCVRRSLRLAKIQSSKFYHSTPKESSLVSIDENITGNSKLAQSWSNILIEGVCDIDDCDKEKLVLASIYAKDIYEYLFQLELKQPIYKEHLRNQLSVTPTMRARLMDWLNEVHADFHLELETYFMTVSLIDLFTQEVKDTKREEYQLLGVTAMFIAAKYEELYPPLLDSFVYVTDDFCQSNQIKQMEIRVLKTLNYNISRPLSIHFLRRFSKAADTTDEVHTMAKYFLELTTIEYSLAAYHPSEIAAASLLLALHLCTSDAQQPTGINPKLWSATLQYYSHYTANHLSALLRKIATIAFDAPNAKLTVVYRKYQSRKYKRISLRSELYGDLMNSIVLYE